MFKRKEDNICIDKCFETKLLRHFRLMQSSHREYAKGLISILMFGIIWKIDAVYIVTKALVRIAHRYKETDIIG